MSNTCSRGQRPRMSIAMGFSFRGMALFPRTLDSGMAGLLDALGEPTGDEVALNAQSPRDDERILLGGRLKGAQAPEGVRAVLREGLPVEDYVIGLDRFCAHGLLPWALMNAAAKRGKFPRTKGTQDSQSVLRLGAGGVPSAADDFWGNRCFWWRVAYRRPTAKAQSVDRTGVLS